ncbi:MAG TPA: phage baseplate assembly protein V [Mycobacterium sp.]|jgi:phage baseplate assembly protein gpV
MIEDTIRDIAEGIAGTKHKIYGVVTGTVINVLDPLTLGRVQVQIDAIDSADLSPWARVATPMTGVLSGTYFIPSVGDEVLVAFEHGDPNAPYVIGSLWNAVHPPPYPTPLIQERAIRTPLGNQIGFREAPPAITITTPDMTLSAVGMPPGVTIASNVMITLLCGPTALIMTPQGITINAPNVNIVSQGPITQTGASSTVTVAGPASVTSTSAVSIAAPVVKIN